MTKVVAAKNTQTDWCHRCGGLMLEERVSEIGSINWRCVSCGERIAPVILAHRQKDLARVEAERLFAGKGKARLN
jgi:ribosomal protein L37AE/L43A